MVRRKIARKRIPREAYSHATIRHTYSVLRFPRKRKESACLRAGAHKQAIAG